MPKRGKHQTPRRATKPKPPAPESRPTSIVGIGASAGGLEAFEQLLFALPADTGMAFVLVQHLAPDHESILSEILRRSAKMPVIEVSDGIRVEANHVYVIPPNAEMSIDGGILHLFRLDPDRLHRMPIDLFFRSLGEDQQSRAIGVILSGTASDGTLGLRAIKALGGITFAQDEASAKYNAMPRSAIAAGNVDFVLPPDMIARELKRISKEVHVLIAEDASEPEPPRVDETMAKIFGLIKNFGRVDFSYYKPGTLKRRITRRMFLRKIQGQSNYLQYLRKNPEEVEALFNDVLINVTSFFRDPEAFDALAKNAFPVMMKGKAANSPIRIWVPGCSTGEEAYSLAIVLLEYLGDRAASMSIQVFATDVSDAIIQKARAGMYPQSIEMDVSPERLRRFFQKVDGGYQVTKMLRDVCVFAKQDIAKDPPFSKLDIVSCRNVMIYMSQVLQKRIIPVFHYALNNGGILFLGSSETVGGFGDLFLSIDKRFKIYIKKPRTVSLDTEFVPRYESAPDPRHHTAETSAQRLDLGKIADQMLLNRYAPASLVVNENLDIVQFIGRTGPFLDPAPGGASLNLLKMVKSGLHMELRVAFQKVKRDGAVRKDGVLIESNGGLKTVSFEIIQVKNVPGKEQYYLIVFEETGAVTKKQTGKIKEKPSKKTSKTKATALEIENARLKEELDATREYLQSIIEEQRTTNEELRSANEEIQSSNEELQSINEELETAKEELQSTNEELTTVNEELQNRNDEMTVINNDLNNLLSSVNIPIIMLGNDLRLRRFTPVAEMVMNLIPADIGRPVTDIKSNLKQVDLKQLILKVIESLEIHDSEVQDQKGKWYAMRIRPYRTLDNKIDGVVIVLLDLDKRLQPK